MSRYPAAAVAHRPQARVEVTRIGGASERRGVALWPAVALGLLLVVGAAEAQTAMDELGSAEPYVCVQLARAGTFATDLDGIACDGQGNLYVGNLTVGGEIRQLLADGQTHDVTSLPDACPAGGMQARGDGTLLVADARYHRIVQVDPTTMEVSEYGQGLASLMMRTPTHMALAANGMLFVTDPDWERNTGQLWRIAPSGAAYRLAAGLGTVAGVALSPQESTLYVSESAQQEVWAYDLSAAGTIAGRRLLLRFDEGQPDAMTVDAAGDLYVTLQGVGAVAQVSPAGQVLRQIALSGTEPTAITLGGADGCTCFVTLTDLGSVEGFRVETPGLVVPSASKQTPPASWSTVKIRAR